eukprot:13773030-Heterocapsa_arctica.AAC.2
MAGSRLVAPNSGTNHVPSQFPLFYQNGDCLQGSGGCGRDACLDSINVKPYYAPLSRTVYTSRVGILKLLYAEMSRLEYFDTRSAWTSGATVRRQKVQPGSVSRLAPLTIQCNNQTHQEGDT